MDQREDISDEKISSADEDNVGQSPREAQMQDESYNSRSDTFSPRTPRQSSPYVVLGPTTMNPQTSRRSSPCAARGSTTRSTRTPRQLSPYAARARIRLSPYTPHTSKRSYFTNRSPETTHTPRHSSPYIARGPSYRPNDRKYKLLISKLVHKSHLRSKRNYKIACQSKCLFRLINQW